MIRQKELAQAIKLRVKLDALNAKMSAAIDEIKKEYEGDLEKYGKALEQIEEDVKERLEKGTDVEEGNHIAYLETKKGKSSPKWKVEAIAFAEKAKLDIAKYEAEVADKYRGPDKKVLKIA